MSSRLGYLSREARCRKLGLPYVISAPTSVHSASGCFAFPKLQISQRLSAVQIQGSISKTLSSQFIPGSLPGFVGIQSGKVVNWLPQVRGVELACGKIPRKRPYDAGKHSKNCPEFTLTTYHDDG